MKNILQSKLSKGIFGGILTVLFLSGSMFLIYVYSPGFIPTAISSAIKSAGDKIVGEELAEKIDDTRDENGATSIRLIFNDNKEENLEKHCDDKDEREQEQNKCENLIDDDTEPGKKIYRNDEFGYSVKYPEGWIQGKNNNVVGLQLFEESSDGLFIYEYSNINTSIDDWFNSTFSETEIKFRKIREFKINGNAVTEFKQDEGMQERHFVIRKDDKLLDILVNGIEEADVQKVVGSIKF